MEAPMTLTDAQVSKLEGSQSQTSTSAPDTLTDQQISQFESGPQPTGSYQTFQKPETDVYDDVPFQASPANPMQRLLMSFADRPQGKAIIAENLGFDVGGFRDDGKMMIRNQKTGEYVPVTPDVNGFTDFMRDIAGRVAEFVPDAATIVTSIAGEIAGTPGGPAGMVAGGTAGAAVGEAAKQGVASALTGQNEMDPTSIAASGGGALVGYGLYGLGKAALKGAGKQIYAALAKAGPAADELAQMVTGKPKNFSETFRNLVKQGANPDDIVNAAFKEDSFLAEIPRNTFFGGRKEAINTENFIRTYKRNIGAATNKESVRDLYRQSFDMSDEVLESMEKRSLKDLLDKSKTDERSLINLGHEIREDLKTGYKNLQHEYDVVYANMSKLGKDRVQVPMANHWADMLKSLRERGIISEKSSGEMYFNPDYSNKSAQSEYKALLKRFRLLGNVGGDEVILPISKMEAKYKNPPAGWVMSGLKESQYSLDRMIDPKSSVPSVDKAPMAQFVNSVRKSIDEKIDYAPLKDLNARYAKFMSGKSLFDDSAQRGVEGELGMLKTMKDLIAVKDPKNIVGNQEAIALRDAVGAMDKYMPRGKEILPRILDTAASRELQVMEGSLPKATDNFMKLLDHSIQKESQESAIKHLALSTWNDALPGPSRFLMDAKKHILSKTFLDSGSLFTSRWLGFMIGSLFGGGSTAIGKLRNIGIGMYAAKPSTWAKHILPIVARAEAGMPLSAASSPFAQKALQTLGTLSKRTLAQGGQMAGQNLSQRRAR